MSRSIKLETVNAVTTHLISISEDQKIYPKAQAVVRRILGAMLYGEGEEEKIGQDCVQYVIANLLESLLNDTARSFSDENLGERVISRRDVEAYIMAGIKNYCRTRAERWSLNKVEFKEFHRKSENHNGVETSLNGEKTERNSRLKKFAVRARKPIFSKFSSDSDFWDELAHTEFDHEYYSKEKVAEFLSERGLSGEEIDLIYSRLSGTSFIEMANESGGTPDKYRKKYNRALKKANLEL